MWQIMQVKALVALCSAPLGRKLTFKERKPFHANHASGSGVHQDLPWNGEHTACMHAPYSKGAGAPCAVTACSASAEGVVGGPRWPWALQMSSAQLQAQATLPASHHSTDVEN